MKRRDFLKYNTLALPTAAGSIGVRSLAKSPFLQSLYNPAIDTDKVLVLIYMAGGNDGLNTIVPIDQMDVLNKVRPEVVLPESSLLAVDGQSKLAFHPSMGALQNLYNDGQMAVVQSVGYPNQDFSHFRSTDIWMTGSDADEVTYTGWLGRYLNMEYPNFPIDYPNEIMPDPLGIQIGYNLSVAFQGPASAMGMVVGDPDWFYRLVNDELIKAPDTKVGRKLDYIRLVTRQSQVYGEVIKNAAAKVTQQSAYPDTELANQLKVVSRLIAGGLKTRIYMVSLDGFDTHDSQVIPSDHTQGEHANLLTELSEGVQAFLKDIEGLGISDRILTMTVSEFGRRIISNASNGTDHGASAPVMLFGENVEAGIYGENPKLPENAEWEDNLPMQYDFRSIYHSVLKNWFCLNQSELATILTRNFQDLPIIKNSPCLATSTREQNQKAGKSWFELYPNPFVENTQITYQSEGESILIQLFNPSGQAIKTLVRGVQVAGTHTLAIDMEGLPAGNYFVRYQTQYFQQGKWAVKVR